MKINYLLSSVIIGMTMMTSTAVVAKPVPSLEKGTVVNITTGRGKDVKKAIAHYTQVINTNPGNFEAYYQRGTSQAKLNNWQEAIADYDQAIKIKPNNADVYYQRGFARSELNDYQGALEDLNQAIRLNPQYSQAYHRRGFVRERLNDADGAVSDYTFAVKILLDRVR